MSLVFRSGLLGDTPTAAEFSTAIALPYANMPLADFAAVHAGHERLNALTGWRDQFHARG